jgi:hypothetical protein
MFDQLYYSKQLLYSHNIPCIFSVPSPTLSQNCWGQDFSFYTKFNLPALGNNMQFSV